MISFIGLLLSIVFLHVVSIRWRFFHVHLLPLQVPEPIYVSNEFLHSLQKAKMISIAIYTCILINSIEHFPQLTTHVYSI